MIDQRLIQYLQSKDVEIRKKAVTALAKTKDPDALPYLAKVYKDDSSAEVRELARKAGVYIKQNAATAPAQTNESDDYADDAYDYEDDDSYDYDYDNEDDAGYDADSRLYDDVDDADAADDIPLPSEISVSKLDEQRAQGYIEQATNAEIRGDRDGAASLISRALRLNPKLMHDSYTVSLAASVTGLEGQQAIQALGPSTGELRKKKKEASQAGNTGVQQVMGLMVMLGAVTVLVSYFIMPWLDMGSIPVEGPEEGQTSTLQEGLDALDEQLNNDENRASLVAFLGEDGAADLISALTGLNITFTGLDSTLLAIGASDIYEVMGINAFVDAFSSVPLFGSETEAEALEPIEYEPVPLDYSLVLIPIAALLALIFALLVTIKASIGRWVPVVIMGLLGVGPVLYFYLSVVNQIIPDDVNLGGLAEGGAAIPDGTSLIGLGFWVSLVGMLAVVILPFVAMLLLPSPDND